MEQEDKEEKWEVTHSVNVVCQHSSGIVAINDQNSQLVQTKRTRLFVLRQRSRAVLNLTCAKYSRISLPLKSVLCSRSRASAAASASLKLIRTRRKDLKYWNVTSGSNERNRASKLPWMETERVEIRISRRNEEMGENKAVASALQRSFLPLIYKY